MANEIFKTLCPCRRWPRPNDVNRMGRRTQTSSNSLLKNSQKTHFLFDFLIVEICRFSENYPVEQYNTNRWSNRKWIIIIGFMIMVRRDTATRIYTRRDWIHLVLVTKRKRRNIHILQQKKFIICVLRPWRINIIGSAGLSFQVPQDRFSRAPQILYFQNFFEVPLQFFSKIIQRFLTIFCKFFQKSRWKFHEGSIKIFFKTLRRSVFDIFSKLFLHFFVVVTFSLKFKNSWISS